MDSSSPKVVTTITLAPALRDRLDDVADAMDRSRSWVASKAIEQFIANSGSVQSPERGLDGSCPAEKNTVDQRGALQPSRLVEPLAGAAPPSASVGAFQAAYAQRQANATRAQETALAGARDAAIDQIRSYSRGKE